MTAVRRRVREQSPAPGVLRAQTITQPYHIVVVPRSDLPVRFARVGDAPENGSHP